MFTYISHTLYVYSVFFPAKLSYNILFLLKENIHFSLHRSIK